MDKDDKDLLPPSVDPNKKAIGIRKVTAINEASTRSVMTVRGHIVITDEKGSDTGPAPLELTLSSLIGCEGVIINRCAEVMSFTYSRVEIEAEGEVDQHGSRGVRRCWRGLLSGREEWRENCRGEARRGKAEKLVEARR